MEAPRTYWLLAGGCALGAIGAFTNDGSTFHIVFGSVSLAASAISAFLAWRSRSIA